MKTFNFFILIFSIYAINSTANAAPFPATATSELISAHSGLYRSPTGFIIHTDNTNWMQTKQKRKNKYIKTLYRAPISTNGVQAAMTVRIDKLKQTSIRHYLKRWVKDYPRLGFKVLASKKLNINGNKAHLIDLLSKSSQKRLRQVIYYKNKKIVILTCRDHRQSFLETVKSCNQIIKNFKWL